MNQTELLDAFPQIAWLLARDGRIAWLNRRWYDYTGQEREPALPGSDRNEQFTQAVDAADLVAAQQTLCDNLAHDVADFALELRLRRADGASRWFRVQLCAPNGTAEHRKTWMAICTDVDDHKRQGQRFAFIARAGEALAESLDLQTTLERLLGIVIPDFGDWAAIDLFDEDGRLKTAAAIHADPRRASLVQRLVARYNHNPQAETIIAAALRRDRPLILNGVTRESIAKAAAPDLLDVLCALSPHSAVTLPLRTRAGTIGSLVAYWAETPCEYSQEDLPLFAELTRRAAVAIENARLYEREREIATEFQRAALPISLPDVPGVRFSGIYVPASNRELIGGDWYDALRLSDGRIVVSIGDVAGSGLSAAVIMASMRQVLRGVAQVYADPIAMLDAADKTLKTEHPETFVTAFVGVLDPVARTLTYASAGHPPPLLRHADGSVEALRGGELPLGLRARAEAAIGIALPESSTLVFYSDGLIEADRDIIASQARLLQTVARDDVAASPNPARALYDAMLGAGAGDDVVILTLGIDGSLGRRWLFDSGDAASAQRARHAFVDDLRRRGMASDTLHTAELIFGELLGNVVRYAPGPIEVMFDWSDSAPVLHVLDRGPGFTLVPSLPSDMLSERGRGLYIVWALAEDFNVTERFDGGSHARAVLAVGVTTR